MTRKKHHYQYHHMLQRAFQMLCFHLVFLSFFNTNNLVKAENIAMFTDNLVTDYRQIIVNQSVYIDGLLLNTSLVDRYESTKYCLLSTISSSMQNGQTSLVKNLMQYSNYTKNTFESKKVYVPCELVIELFCNTNTPVKYVVTHSAFDCGDLLNPNQTTYDLVSDDYSNDTTSTSNNIMKVVYLSPTVQQIEISLKSFMNRYSLTHYGIVYTNSYLYGSSSSWSVRAVNFYQQFAADLVYQLSNDLSFNLDFSVQLYDPTLPYILTSYVKIIFLVLRCGEEAIFMKLYWSQINAYGINVIAIYDSPQCLAVVNINNQFSTLNSTQLSTYKYLYKLVAVDINNDFVSYGNRLQSMIYQNLQNNYLYESSNVLDEIESYYQASYYNSTRNTTSLNELNETTTLKCFVSSQILSTNLTFKYCYRRVQFILFGFNNSTNNYSQVGYITLPDITNTETSYNATVTMFGNYTFQQITTTPTTTTSNDEIFKDVLFAVIAMVIFVVLVGILAYIARSRLMRKELSKGPNKILLLPEDLEFVTATSSTFLSRQNVRDQNDQNKSQHSLKSEQGTTNTMGMGATRIAKYKGDVVVVKYLKIPNFQMKNSTMREFRMLRDLRHENLNVFMGCYIDLKSPALIFDYATRGSLQDIILKKDIKLDWNFKWSMLNDLCRGMRYLHHSPLKYHGNLKSRNCVVDSRWVLKVTDFGLPNMYSNQNYSRTLNLSDLLWTAPEHLRQTTIRDQVVISIGSQSGDIYSFAIIMQELIVRGTPFCMMGLTDEEIINKIRKPPPLLRPSVSKTAAPPEYVNIMRDCWSEQPELRPTFDQLYSMFKSLNGDKKVNIVDLMFKMIEQYTNNLEDLVKEKTVKLEEEKKKTEKLLSEMLPKTVAESLMSGGTVLPESFDMVTIYFSDIVGFTTISAYSSPFEVVQLLNDLYTMFDDICDDFDVYKVETIGDAYMVVSGLPIRNGNKHAGEIATMALNLLHHCGKFKIRHLPGIPLRLRIGLHSGACVSGVVGSKMPRYCLFGDTVNTASRMESTSQAYRIHVSQSCATILDEIGGYQLELRGETELKGKGKHKTYWLVGKDGFDKELPDPVVSENNHGIDSQLIQTIERIKAEQKLVKKEEKQEEMVVHNPSIFKELTALESGRKKSKNADIDEEDEEEEGGRKLSESMKITSSREGLKSASKNRASTGSHNTLGMKTTMPQMPPKNDSGFSEPITANSTPTSGKLPANVDHKPSAGGKPKMPDVDSVV